MQSKFQKKYFSFAEFLCETMDNGWSDREKNHQTSKVWAFWAMYVGCPDKIHLCWKKCSTEYQIHIGTWGYEESKSKSLKNYYWIKFQLKLVILDQWTQYIAEWDGYEVNLCHWKQMLGCEKFSRAAHAQPHLKKNFARTFARTSSFRQSHPHSHFVH